MAPPPPVPLNFAVLIDGKSVQAKSSTGGYVKAEVTTTFSGAGGPPQRRITSFAYTNLQVQLGLELGTPILNWVNAALRGSPVTKTGTLIELDTNNRAKSYLDFTGAAIADFVVPGFDASNNATNVFTLEASITKSTFRPGNDALVPLTNRMKPFLTNNFRLTIDGLPTARVRSIAPLSFRRAGAGIVPTDLVVTFSSNDVAPWRAWADDFIVAGHNSQDKEKQGTIEVLAPNLADVLATLTIRQIGILELTPTDDTTIRSHRARMYFESAQLSYPA